MKKLTYIFLFLITLSATGFTKDPEKSGSKIGIVINDFSLRSTDNSFVSLNKFPDAKGFIVVFTCNHCPFAKLYSQRFNDLNTKYKKSGVPFLAINSMDTAMYDEERFELLQEKAKTDQFNFPYLMDADQSVGKNFNAEHTPHAFVIWRENNNWVVKYSGAIDDNGEHPELATSLIGNAVDNLLAGKPVASPETQSFGCRIYYRK